MYVVEGEGWWCFLHVSWTWICHLRESHSLEIDVSALLSLNTTSVAVQSSTFEIAIHSDLLPTSPCSVDVVWGCCCCCCFYKPIQTLLLYFVNLLPQIFFSTFTYSSNFLFQTSVNYCAQMSMGQQWYCDLPGCLREQYFSLGIKSWIRIIQNMHTQTAPVSSSCPVCLCCSGPLLSCVTLGLRSCCLP